MTRLQGPIALLAAFVVQLTLSRVWPVSVALFDLPLLVVLYYALNRGPIVGLVLGGAVGLFNDGLAGSLLGAGALARCLVGYMAGSAVTRFVLSGPLAQFLVVATATLATRILEFLTLAVMGWHLVTPSPPELLAGAIGNGALGTVLFSLIQRERPS